MTDPVCDIEETKSHTFLSIDIPNVNVGDLKITISGKNLFVAATRQHRNTVGKDEVKVIQCHHQNFFREYSFPIPLHADSIHAFYQNGILKIGVPKTNIISKQEVVVHNSPIGVFLTPSNKPAQKRSEPIESYSDIDDYDWE